MPAHDGPRVRARHSVERGAVVYSIDVATMSLLPGDNRAKAIARAGFRRPAAFALWSRLLWRLRPRHILDIGANHGEMSLPLLLRPEQHMHLFEPNPDLVKLLGASARTHLQADQIAVLPVALSDRGGETRMFVDRKWSGTSSLDHAPVDARFKGEGEQAIEELVVETRTLDGYFESACLGACGARDLIAVKLDVEGHEARVLEGGRETLARPMIMLTEFSTAHLRASGAAPADYLARLLGLGRVFRIARDQPPAEILAHQPDMKHVDLLVTNDATALAMIG